MIAKNCSNYDLEQALQVVNKKYDGNIKFKAINPLNSLESRWRFTLTVINSHKKGGRLGVPHTYWTNKNGTPYKQKHITAACWHVHGDFFDELFKINPESSVLAGAKKINKDQGNWEDWNIGSQMEPYYYSEACMCDA